MEKGSAKLLQRVAGFAATRTTLTFTVLLLCFYAVGTIGHLLDPFRPLMLGLTPWFLLLSGGSALALAWPEGKNGLFLLWLVPAWAITLFLEILGVATGLVFGSYHYGQSLGFMVFEVPLIIGFNWVLVILACASLFRDAPGGRIWGPLPAALLATGFDWVMEPVAMRLDYWQWAGDVIPLQNYLAWFTIALVMSAAWYLTGLRLRRRTVAILALVELVFFAILRTGLTGW